MDGFSWCRGSIFAVLGIPLFTLACSRPTPDLPSEGVSQSDATPFQSQAGDAVHTGIITSTVKDLPTTEPPFHSSEVLPAGTLLIVSLKAPLVAGGESKVSFEAVLDEPVVMDGITVIPREAIVSGRIESAHVSKATPERDYVRLTLNSVEVDGLSVPIQTASLFARQLSAADADAATIRLKKGRRLTFRLKEPVFLHPGTQKANN